LKLFSRPHSTSFTERGTPRRNVGRMSAVLLLAALFLFPLSTYGAPTPANAASTTTGPYPVGIPNSAEPSGLGPPGPNDIAGYTQNYVNDFTDNTLPAGWFVSTRGEMLSIATGGSRVASVNAVSVACTARTSCAHGKPDPGRTKCSCSGR
jgi:hypothetical protein